MFLFHVSVSQMVYFCLYPSMIYLSVCKRFFKSDLQHFQAYSLFNLRSTPDKLVSPELEVGVVDELYESDEQSPRVRSVHNHSLQQHARDLFLDVFRVGLCEQVEEHTAEVVCVVVRVSQVVRDRVQKQIAAWK